jgi:16S rRNA G966 N2-methylase RsmD
MSVEDLRRSHMIPEKMRLRRPGFQPLKSVYVRIRGLVDGLLCSVALDRRFGIETGGVVRLRDLGLAAQDRIDYVPSEWLGLRRVFRDIEVREDDVLLDLGAGKGRAVLVAAARPFKRIVGVELSDELSAVARENVRRCLGRLRCRNIEIVTSDVLDYDIPDDVTVVFLYAPFTGTVFSRVVAKVLASVDRNPRRLRMIYSYPTEQTALMFTGRARQVKSWQHRAIAMYELRPRPESAADRAGLQTSVL